MPVSVTLTSASRAIKVLHFCAHCKSDGLAGGRVTPRVFQQDIEQALECKIVGFDPNLVRIEFVSELNLSFGEALSPLLGDLIDEVGKVDRFEAENLNTGVGAGEREKLVDKTSHLHRVMQDTLAGLAVVGGIARKGEGNLGLGAQQCNGGTQFMRRVGGKRSDTLVSGLDAAEHLVQCIGEGGEFIASVQFGQAAVEVLVVDALCLGRDGGDGRKGFAAHEIAGQRRQDQAKRSEQKELNAESWRGWPTSCLA